MSRDEAAVVVNVVDDDGVDGDGGGGGAKYQALFHYHTSCLPTKDGYTLAEVHPKSVQIQVGGRKRRLLIVLKISQFDIPRLTWNV